jgi:transposase
VTLTRDEIRQLIQNHPETLVDYVLVLQDQVAALTEQVRHLTAEVADLKSRLNKNSRNSSKPPSSDGLKKPKNQSLRKKSLRKTGGQPGHEGHTLERVDHPDQEVVLPLLYCTCHHFLGDQPAIDRETRQVFELPEPKLEVIEYQAEIKQCPACGTIVRAAFPQNVVAPVQYGQRFKSFVLYLHHQHLLPSNRIRQICLDLFGCSVSEQILFGETQTCSERLREFEQDLVLRLTTEPVLNVDETGFNVLQKGHWLHTATTDHLTFYGVHPGRGRDAMDSFGILPDFRGTLVHDCLPAYAKYPCTHAFCNAHLLRELKFLYEERHQSWANDMSELLVQMNDYINVHPPTGNRLSEQKKKPWLGRYRKIVSAGEAANPLIEPVNLPKKRGRKKKSPEQNLLARLRQHENEILRFLHDLKVPFTNNLAEQDIRMMKVRQKVSGCFRTFKGAQSFARIRSYLSTCRKNGRNILQSLIDALNGQANLSNILSSTGTPE